MSCAETAKAVQDLNATVRGMLPDAESRVAALEVAVANRLATINTGFGVSDFLHKLTDAPVVLQPRFDSLQNARDFVFSAAEDYAPAGSFHDFRLNFTGALGYLKSSPRPAMLTEKVSIYASISVGTENALKETRLAILENADTAFHQLLETQSPTPNYSEPRLLLGKSEMESFPVISEGNDEGIYNKVIAIAENQVSRFHPGMKFLRFINLGSEIVKIKSLVVVYHGEFV